MTPSVSVIIPTYNRRSMVNEAVDTVLAQRYGNFELIVVDDGSTDGTARELGAYAGALRVVSQARRGVAAARNLGARVARGHYLAFLDSDDLWLPKKLEVQTAFMTQFPQVQICQTEEVWLRRGMRINPKAKHRKPSGDIFRRSLELCLVSPSAVMMTRRLFEQIGGFDESFSVCEDYDLWLRIAVDHALPLIPAPLVVKRGGHADQLSRSEWGMDRFRIRALSKLLRSGIREQKRDWVIDELKRKVSIFCAGARKRHNEKQALAYEKLLTEFLEETIDAGQTNSPVRSRETFPYRDT